MTTIFKQYKQILRHFVRQEFSTKERLVTPVLFSLVILLIFAFANPDVSPEIRLKMLVGQGLISAFFALQISVSRSFETESQDRVFEMIRVYPTNTTVFVLAKLTMVFSACCLTFFSTILLASLFYGQDVSVWMSIPAFIKIFFTVASLASLGVLLAAITLKSQARQILFPILFFPLSTPVLIAASEGLIETLEKNAWTEVSQGWTVILASFFAIFFTLAILLGGESLANDT